MTRPLLTSRRAARSSTTTVADAVAKGTVTGPPSASPAWSLPQASSTTTQAITAAEPTRRFTQLGRYDTRVGSPDRLTPRGSLVHHGGSSI